MGSFSGDHDVHCTELCGLSSMKQVNCIIEGSSKEMKERERERENDLCKKLANVSVKNYI